MLHERPGRPIRRPLLELRTSIQLPTLIQTTTWTVN